MKKLFAILLLAALALCQLTPACAEDDRLSQILAKGEMTIACEGTYKPWNYEDENGELMGYDVEVARAICDILGVKANILPCQWDGIFAGLETGNFDVAISDVTVTEERAEKYDFSTPYAFSRVSLIVRSDNEDIKSFEDLKGRTTCNTITSIYAQIAEQFGAEVTPVDDLAQTLMLVEQGRIDATLNNNTAFIDYMTTRPDAPFKIVDNYEEAENIAIPVMKGEEALLNAINDALAQLAENGTLTELSMKYFGLDISKME